MAQNNATERVRRTNIPDAIPGPETKGHLREWAHNATLGCGPHKLPAGTNY